MPLMVRMYPIHNGKKEYSDIIPALDHAKTHDIAVSVVPIIRSISDMNYKSNTKCWYTDDMFRSDRTALTSNVPKIANVKVAKMSKGMLSGRNPNP